MRLQNIQGDLKHPVHPVQVFQESRHKVFPVLLFQVYILSDV